MNTVKILAAAAAMCAAIVAANAQEITRSWDFSQTSDTMGWSTSGPGNYVPNSSSGGDPFRAKPLAWGDGDEDDDVEIGRIEFGFYTQTLSNSGGALISDETCYAGLKLGAGEMGGFIGGWISFHFNESFDEKWADPSRVPGSNLEYFYMDGMLDGEYVMLRAAMPFVFSTAEDSIVSLNLDASQFEMVTMDYEWDALSPMGPDVTTVVSALTDEQFASIMSGEVGLYFRMIANEAVYVGAPDPVAVTQLKGVYLSSVPEASEMGAVFGAFALALALYRRRRQ